MIKASNGWCVLTALLVCFLVSPLRGEQKPVRVIIMAGQSNMDGRGYEDDLPIPLRMPQNDILFYWKDSWTRLQPGSTDAPRHPVRFGPEITFGRAIADRWPSEQVAIIKHSEGGTSVAVDWKPKTGPQYQKLIQKVNKATQDLASEGKAYKIIGMIWLQGEKDARDQTHAAEYEHNLASFIAAVRQDVHNPDLPFVFGLISPPPVPDYPYRELVQKAQTRVAQSVRATRIVKTDDLPLFDVAHYTGKAQIELGRRFAQALLNMLRAPAR
jgi:hypothetical protein